MRCGVKILVTGGAGFIGSHVCDEFVERELPGTRPDTREVSHHPFPGEIGAFADAVLTGVDPPANLEDAVKTHELCIAADISAAERGRPVKLPLLEPAPRSLPQTIVQLPLMGCAGLAFTRPATT